MQLTSLLDASPELAADECLMLVKDGSAGVRYNGVDNCKESVCAEVAGEGRNSD